MMLLVAPGLLALAAACRARPAFARLAHYAGSPLVDRDGLAMLTCRALGVPEPPVGALTAAGVGLAAGARYWLMADPVTLVPGRSDVALAGLVPDLEPDEAEELLIALNAHFHDDDIEFVAPRPDLWLASVAEPPALYTTTLDRAAQGALSEALPRGDAGALWRRWQDEIQMLLHTHPVNGAREARGLRPANAVWFWGGGRQLDAREAAVVQIDAPPTRLGDLVRGLADTARATADADTAPRHVLVHDTIASEDDLDAFVALALEPALAALERREYEELAVAADGSGPALAWCAPAPGAMRRLTARWPVRSFVVPETV